jgi:hypothetical protein
LTFLAFFPIIHPFEIATAQTTDQSQNFIREFAWYYDGYHWVWNLSIPVSLFDAYTSIPDSARTGIGISNFGYFTTTKDSYIEALADKLNQTATQLGLDSYDETNFVLAFVQSIPYETDFNSTGYQDYPRFPVETLVDNVGDCKSHSILFASLTLSLGYGTVFINPPDHLAVGILGNNLQGSYWTYDNQTYYYCETTGSGFTIGQLPDQFSGQSANVYPIDDSLQYVANLQTPAQTEPNPTTLTTSPYESETTPTLEPTPSNSPIIAQPTIQPNEPISVNLISDAPIFFIVIVIAIAASIAVTVLSASHPKEKLPPNKALNKEPNSTSKQETTKQATKFCIYCGASNKSFAAYCESCGKKIA